MKLVKSIMTNNPCYKAGKKIKVKGLILHSVGCAQPNANVFIRLWNNPKYDRACVHGFIDANDGTVYQTLPWDHRGWHAGGSANDTHIGVEMCEPDCIKYTGGSSFECSDIDRAKAMVRRTYKAAVELYAKLCTEYKLNPLENGVILSHKEAHAKGLASNHGDPEHLWTGLGLGYTMDGFRKDVKKAMTEATESPKKEESKPVSKQESKPVNNASDDFKVKVSIPNLNIRKGPGTNYSRTGKFTGVGVFTIVETEEGKGSTKGWGKLKSGAGWISLDFAKKI